MNLEDLIKERNQLIEWFNSLTYDNEIEEYYLKEHILQKIEEINTLIKNYQYKK